MLSSFKTRFRSLIWFLIFTFLLYSTPHFEILIPYKIHFSLPEAQAEEAQEKPLEEPPEKKPPPPEEPPKAASLPAEFQGQITPIVSLNVNDFTGAALMSYPIGVPPGRNGIAPRISLLYNNYHGNGWLGVGWGLDMGAIQRSTKRGVNYSANDYVAIINGSTSELLPRSDWGVNCYGSKIEGSYSKYYFNSSTGGWDVTTKDGTRYYYGTTSASRQDNPNGVFKWCLDKVQDTNGNYMTIAYWKDQGEIYLDRIDYTGNGSLSPTNYVKFYLDGRTDIPLMYPSNTLVKTAYRLKTIQAVASGSLVRAYKLTYTSSASTHRSLLSSVQEYGADATLDASGEVTGGTALPPITFWWEEEKTHSFTDGPLFYTMDAQGWDVMYWGYGDFNGDGKTDMVYHTQTAGAKRVKFSNAGMDLILSLTNTLGATTIITYTPSSAYTNTLLPFILQTVSSISANDGKGNTLATTNTYSGGLYDYSDREFRGFRKATGYQMYDLQHYESMTETWFHQDYYRKGKIETQILTSKDSHTRRVANVWDVLVIWNESKFPRLLETTSNVTDQGTGGPYSYNHRSTYAYDQYLNVSEEHKYGLTSEDEIHTYFSYTSFIDKWILSKPTDINMKNSSGSIVGRKWMDYDSITGNMTKEEVCKSDTQNTGCVNRNETQNSVITYQYYTEGNLWKITDPRNYTTTVNYDSTKTFVYETINYLSHKTTTEYDPGTGNLKKLIPPHLQGTSYSITYTYDVFGRKTREDRPDGGWTSYQYLNLGNPNTQYTEKREHIIGGISTLDHYTYNFFDGLGRTYRLETTGPGGKRIVTETLFDNIGRVWKKSNPYFYGIDTPYYTTFTYDGLSRVIDILTTDNYHIGTSYQGLKKAVTNQRGYATSYTYNVYQRLKKVEDPNGTTTEYSYDKLGNLIQVVAAKDRTEQNTTTMTYDSLSKKRTMTDPDMGYWTYQYDKSGNLTSQTDAKSQTITFNYDGLNRLTQKIYPTHTVQYTYDDASIPYSKGKLTKVSGSSGGETKEDLVLEYDLMQRVKKSQKTIGANSATFESSYDSIGRTLSIKYLAGTPSEKVYSYEYDVAGDLLYVKDNATGNHLADYSDFTALSQQKIATFPEPNNVSVKTTYTYNPQTARIQTLLTQKLVGGTPTDTYQNLNYQQFDPKGNILTLVDNLNGITHSHTYDSLDRILTAQGTGTNPYTQSYQYDRIGNITFKSDVGSYSYTYSNKPHAVRTAGNISLQYDLNGNITRRSVSGGIRLDITYNYDNKPSLIKKNGSNYVQFTYDGNSQRVKKYNYTTGQTNLYFGELYETRGGVGIIHVFAGGQRVASVLADGRTQFYHSNHLGSASVVTDQSGERKEQIEYYPFGTYRAVGNINGTYDFDASFPDVFYTFTGQEDDDDLGLYNYRARLYDPVLGRFISPDGIVPYPDDPQSLNRFSYVNNNPLKYVDPEGYFLLEIIVGAVIGAVSAAVRGGNWKDVLKGAAFGAICGAVGSLVGVEVAYGAYDLGAGEVGSAIIGGAAGGAAAGATNAALTGGNVWQSTLIGGISGGIAGGVGIAVAGWEDWVPRGIVQVGTGALVGGTVAELTGGKFYEGALMGAASGAVGFSASEFVGQYLQEVDQKIFGTAKELLYPESARAEQRARDVKLLDPNVKGATITQKQYEDMKSYYLGTKGSFNFDINFQRRFDIFGNGFKFGNMHVQPRPEPIVHFDRYDFVSAPIRHLLYEGWRGVSR